MENKHIKRQMNEALSDWVQTESLAESLIPMVGKLYRECNIILSVYGRPLINRSDIDIIKAHRFVRQIEEVGLTVKDTFPIVEKMLTMDLGPAQVDVGKLALKFKKMKEGAALSDFLEQELSSILGKALTSHSTQDIVLYGFGRIGRLLARILIEKTGGGMCLRAIVVRKGSDKSDLIKRASLLRRDSIHGSYKGTIHVDEENNAIIANGNYIQIIYASAPDEIDYTQYGIDNAIVVDNTGVWRDEAGLLRHLSAKGASRVLLTAPGKGDIKNIVMGVNHYIINDDDKVLSAASCTTNAIVPILKAMNDKFGIENGHIETVHSYTNDQNLIDNYHSADRRGRSAPLNMVITETGAAKAASKALPELTGKLTGNAIRVPTPNVSMAILNLSLTEPTDVASLNNYLRHMALHSDMQKQIDYVNSPDVVSSDFVGSRYSGIVDAEATIVKDNQCVLYVWYDNEFGYSCQVVRIIQHLSNIHYIMLPKEA